MCREINKKDQNELKQIIDIWLNRSIEVHRFVYPCPEKYWKDKIYKFKKEIKKNKGYVYEKNGVIKGFVIWKEDKDSIYIPELFARNNKKGIGTKLLNTVKDGNKGKRIEIKVYWLNTKSVNWYSEKGFVIDEIRECKDGDLKRFKSKKERFKYKWQRLKFHMVCPNNYTNNP